MVRKNPIKMYVEPGIHVGIMMKTERKVIKACNTRAGENEGFFVLVLRGLRANGVARYGKKNQASVAA